MARPRHSKKEIEEAIQYALARGWTVTKSGPRAHGWGKLRCGHGCLRIVASTPSSTKNHADWLRHCVDHCPHQEQG